MLNMELDRCQLSKLYAYNGLMFSSGTRVDGIRIDTTMNAIDTDGNPIPGLYVIGNDSGGFFANTYPNLATGVACGRTVTFGRLVGKHLAKA